MNTKTYDGIVETYKKQQNKKLLIALVVMVVGFAAAATGVGAIAGIVAMIYLMIEGIRTLSAGSMRKKSINQLKENGRYEAAMLALESANKQEMMGLTFAWTQEYFCTGYGAIFAMADIAWVFPFTHTVTYFFIPVVRQHCCKMMLLDGTERIVFHGKAGDKNKAEFEGLLRGMLSVNPELQIGHTPANQELYKQRVQLYKATRGA